MAETDLTTIFVKDQGDVHILSFRKLSLVIKLCCRRNVSEKRSATLLNIQQEQRLISSLGIVPANVWKDFIEPICLKNATNA